MGLQATLYIGPYAVCEVTPVPRVFQVRSCPALMCKKPKPTEPMDNISADFCDSCGCRISLNEITVERSPSPFDALGESERLSPVWASKGEKLIYFICNEGNQARKFILEIGAHVDFHDYSIGEETRWFDQRYAVELEGLAKTYGNFAIRWGIHYFQR